MLKLAMVFSKHRALIWKKSRHYNTTLNLVARIQKLPLDDLSQKYIIYEFWKNTYFQPQSNCEHL